MISETNIIEGVLLLTPRVSSIDFMTLIKSQVCDSKFNLSNLTKLIIFMSRIGTNKNQTPILVGTTSIESSEHLSNCLKKAGLEHQVLNRLEKMNRFGRILTIRSHLFLENE